MARLKETFLAEDQLDYRRLKTGTGAIARTDGMKGLAATLSSGASAGKTTSRPVAKKDARCGSDCYRCDWECE